MDLTAIIISGMAFGLSIFTFYWTSVRETKRLYLIRVDRLAAITTPEFALVNSGSKDVLITSIECIFQNKEKNGGAYPAQKILINESDSLLLASGKAFHCKVQFLEPFTAAFALQGEKDERLQAPIFQRNMQVDVAWIDQNGITQKASTVISKYGFSEDGSIRMHTPVLTKRDLYKP